ncbi:Protein CBG25596 [Caenorhabditis briggsae]|uniref:Protein CBG25596 n=1 Tax=Caenorhabditis briggsae TaxID=6238 RepID=B6IF81_CAEBR|nr:Protein CBG25596 [Caenorhabditis briggsae]CAR98561.1 Protein CBG25596 [Caenorhabditis briggsae]
MGSELHFWTVVCTLEHYETENQDMLIFYEDSILRMKAVPSNRHIVAHFLKNHGRQILYEVVVVPADLQKNKYDKYLSLDM